ncbi:hypothetical protein BDV35DRAFT_384335 [Aspergillus flavus]|uniref:Uncharacterized protein n=1 Tax=Aspergillus flavus TaxID=5059 RepID=A0A5N6GJB3_ASPFL|nr:hypothetical protein BDV35DRAFT_384335 [Aspergillus flavus]
MDSLGNSATICLLGTGWDSVLYLLNIHLDSPITHQPRSELPHLSLSIMPGTVGRPRDKRQISFMIHMRLSRTDSCLLHPPHACHRGQVQEQADATTPWYDFTALSHDTPSVTREQPLPLAAPWQAQLAKKTPPHRSEAKMIVRKLTQGYGQQDTVLY